MVSDKGTAFHAVPISDGEDVREREESNDQFYVPQATKSTVLVFTLSLTLVFIALLQVAVFKSANYQKYISSATNLSKRQAGGVLTTTNVVVQTSTVMTETGTTITFPPSTETYPSTTVTYDVSIQTVVGTTETFPGSTQTFTDTLYYAISTSDGTVITIFPPGATPPSAYLDTSFPTSATLTSFATSEDSTTAGPSSSDYMSINPPSSTASDVYESSSTTASTAYMSVNPPSSTVSIVDATTTSTAYMSVNPSSSSPVIVTLASTSTAYMSANPPSPTFLPGFISLPHSDQVVWGHFTVSRYFVATYLSSLCVVLLKCITGSIFGATKMIEPFYQLKEAGGVDADASLLVDFLSSGISIASLSSLTTKRPAMLVTTMVFALATISAPVASETMSIKASRRCSSTDGNVRSCAPVWILNMPCIRLLQAFLGVIFCLLITCLFLHHTRLSGIYSDPSSIASIASLLGNRKFVEDLQDIPPSASKREIQKLLHGNRYMLGPFQKASGGQGYGIYKASSVVEEWSKEDARNGSRRTKVRFASKGSFIQDFVLLILSTGILGLVLAYALDMHSDSFNDFFNSNTFGPRFVLSALCTLLDSRWKQLEREVRICQPFRELHTPAGASASALLTNTASSTYTSFPLALWRGKFFLALVAMVTLLGDVLIIAVVGIPYTDTELYSAFRVSTWLSVTILSIMIVTSIAAIIWRRGNPPMPRQPDTIMSIALLVCASQMTEQFVPMSTTKETARNEAIKRLNQSYWYGYGHGQDGKPRWLVDKVGEGDQ